MALNLQGVKDALSDQNFRFIGGLFPLQSQSLANDSVGAAQIEAEAVGSSELAKAGVTDEKLASPIIRGQVSSAGAVALGSGFTSEKTATGIYKVTLTTELATPGIMVLTLINSSGSFWVKEASSKKVFIIETTNFAGAAADAAFNFHVIKS